MSGAKVAMAQPHSFQSGALSFMSCTSGRESSPLDESDSHQATEFKTEAKKKRFHPLRNLRRMFRRKTRRSSISAESYQPSVPDNPEIPSTNLEQRSCSTSRLQEENLTQNLMRNSRLNPGLSLSHDSIFTPDKADSGLSSSDLENSSLSITVLTPPSKECPMKSQSSCSETSLLSIGSSEVELSPVRIGPKISDLDLGVTAYKLSHSAAKHKMAVKPRRNHGAPRSRRKTATSKSPLPTTLEVSEEGGTGRSSPPEETPLREACQPSFTCDIRVSDAKTGWSQITIESAAHEPEDKSNEVPKLEDEADAKDETQKTESFFGRFLSRRSEKKKKIPVDPSPEEGGPEDKVLTHFAKKFSKSGEGKSGPGKSPNRRQRVEPVEIPSGCHEREGGRTCSSVSPPKSYWPGQAMSRSISPPKAVWPENFSSYVKLAEPSVGVWERSRREASDASPTKEPTDNFHKDLKNVKFVKELTDSVGLFAKDESGKRKKDGGEEEETGTGSVKARRQHSEDEAPRKAATSAENVSGLSWEKSESAKSEREKTGPNLATSFGEPTCVSVKPPDVFTVAYEPIHDGYENIHIIELVKQETKNLAEVEKKQEKAAEISKTEPEMKKEEVKKAEKEPEVVRRVKPLISEKPKDLKKTGTPEFMRVNLNRVELKSPPPPENEDKVAGKNKSTLVERRKSELMMLTEAEEKDWKAKIKAVKKQTSFSEGEKRDSDEAPKTPAKEGESCPEKTDSPSEDVGEEVVVLRKKSAASESEDQPELMKVFARRSLKVRESVEDMQRSRDSDKENEVAESPEEERKKTGSAEKEAEEAKEEETREPAKAKPEVKVTVTPLKPEASSRKNVVQRYGRSLSENNAKPKEKAMDFKRETSILEENKLNKMRNISEMTISCHAEKKEKGDGGEEEEETGFKRIQQRKAEWERRAQQGAK